MANFASSKNLSQRMTIELGRAIVCGEYPRDKSLPTEAALCEKFGVSRTAVREAIKMLTAKGLITSKPKQGIRIQPEENWNILDPEMLSWSLEAKPSLIVLKEFTQMRMAVEPEACALAARHASPERLAAIESSLVRMEQAVQNNDLAAELEADIDFHVAILYASENRFYIRMRDFTRTALNVSIQHTTPAIDNSESIVDEHARIYNAIKSGNAERAKNSMFLLIDEALSIIEDKLSKI
ncbi:FadR family transcriptional regulator [Paraglaciecola aquimarina]|uniref:FadR family transcriptional regulator n=1 Tax=Paraglaciecola algarum TaxID=3050085 RepID=A0ABS9DAX5_9ALTE|nr:FadR/GntR family transcriptional regulator [Paraglaciecola sp. G1-23]MCF2950116.1 FadR family transcriptional regulator [Paraglaciecola sp. G1-23]